MLRGNSKVLVHSSLKKCLQNSPAPNRSKAQTIGKPTVLYELNASFFCHITQLENRSLIENSAAYIKAWLIKLKNDKQFIFKVSAEAQKAVNYIYTLVEVETEELAQAA